MRLLQPLLFSFLIASFAGCAESSSAGEFNLEIAGDASVDAGMDTAETPDEMPDDEPQGCAPE